MVRIMAEDGKMRIGGSFPILSIFRKGAKDRTAGKAATAAIMDVLKTMNKFASWSPLFQLFNKECP